MAKPLHRTAAAVLGQNARSLFYTGQSGAKMAITIAHNKIATKKLLQKAGLPTPLLRATIRSRRELEKFRWTKLPPSFVLKPNSAYGGSGILVIFGRNKKGNWVKADRAEVSIAELKSHVLDILDGNFSSSGAPDKALFEQRIKNHPDLKQYSPRGIPDIRVIVYNSVPIMAMLRLSTSESQGKSNLHAGGIGVGIDLARGLTTSAIYHGQLIDHLPGKKIPLSGLRLPYWSETLITAVKAARALNLPFAGVDIAIDREDGPLILEINSRPGLDIQLANLSPLRTRLRRVEDLTVTSANKGVKLGVSLFGSDLEQEIEDVTGQTVIGVIEPVTITDSEGHEHKHQAKIDTGAWRTTIDSALAEKYGIHAKITRHSSVRGALGRHKRPVIEIKFKLRGKIIKTQAYIVDRSHLNFPMIIGRRDLRGYLVDPHKNGLGVR